MSSVPSEKRREINYEHSTEFVPLLQQLGISLLVTTYQAGKLVVIGADPEGQLALSFENFEQCMGVAHRGDVLAVGAKQQIWFLQAAPEIAPRLPPAKRFDNCFLTRKSHMTGEIDGHEMAWSAQELWLVNTLFSCVCTLDERHSFVPRWRPRFISSLAAEDRCHLNGMCLVDGKLKYVTALGESDSPQGWRPGKVTGGILMDVDSQEIVTRGMAMAHSPRVHGGQLFVLDSGRGALDVVDRQSGQRTTVTQVPGYTRGMAMHQAYAFIGLSKIRESSTFGGLPIAERQKDLKCGIGIIDLRTGRLAAHLGFTSGVDELFDVQVLPGVRLPFVLGPYAQVDGKQTVWCVPAPRW